MSIQIGDRIPEVNVNVVREGKTETAPVSSLFKNRKVVLFAVPGAFTPTCSLKHLPSYIDSAAEFARRGVDLVCLSVNDAFVMQAWAAAEKAPPGIVMLADGNAAFTKALGLELDATGFGMGLRAQRFALYAEDGVVKVLKVEAPGEFKISGAETMLAALAG